jgi:hypothetical protein
MSPNTSNPTVTSSTPISLEKYESISIEERYKSTISERNTSGSAIDEAVEMRTAHCMNSSPCPIINIELDIKKLELREYLYHLNKKQR